MRSSIALLGLAASVQALESSYSQCTESSVHHATMISTKNYTATLTSIPTNINAASGQGEGSSSRISATATQGYTSADSDTTTIHGSGSATTLSAINTLSSFAASNGVTTQVPASAPGVQSTASAAPGTSDQPSIHYSSSSMSTISIGTSPTPQWSTQSRPSSPSTTATLASTTSGNSSSPKSSVVAFTGASSKTTATGGAMIIAFLFTMILL